MKSKFQNITIKKFVKEQIGERELDYALFLVQKYEEKYPFSIDPILFYIDIYLLLGDFASAQ